MHHPGPPRFVATGEQIELAPRDPDPAATYRWRLVRAPEASAATLGDAPVEHFAPDAPGRYVARLSAPDGEHDLTVRAFPGDRAPASVGGASASGAHSGPAGERPRTRNAAGRSGSGAGGGDGGGDGGRPRVHLSARVEGDEVVVRADPEPNPRASERASDLDVAFELDDRDPVERADVAVGDRELVVPLARVTDRVRVYAVALGADGYSVPDAVEIEPETGETATNGGTDARAESTPAALTRDARVSRPYDPPAWAEDAVVYEVYVRTFAGDRGVVGDGETGDGNGGESVNGDGSETGDGDGKETVFDAIVDRLDYIASLGVDALWLTPVLENDHAPHGYNITDFFSIAEDLGTRDDYRRMVAAAHERDIAVLFDLVCNHSARAHPHFQAAVSDPDSEYRDWYEWRTDAEPETYFEWEYIANFDFDHLPVRRHLLDAVDEWAPLVDGFRCDMAWAVPNAFWREVHDRVKARDPDFLLLDETIPYIPDFQAGLFDEHFDSTTYAALRRVGRGDAPATDVLDAIDERAAVGFPDHAGFLLYAENHDETRYVAECGRPAAEAALGALFTLPGSPMVYAGQEFGQLGKRDDLAWGHADEELVAFVRSLAEARQDPALSAATDLVRVDYEVREGPTDRVVAYGRDPPDADPVVVALNFGESPATVACEGVAGPTDRVSGADLGVGLEEGDGDGDTDAVTVESVAVLPGTPDLGE